MNSLSTKQILAIAGFFIVLISIPLAFYLAKNTQVFQSHASEIKPTPTPLPADHIASTSATEVPATSPLQDLQSLLEATTAADKTSGSSTATGTTAKVAAVTPTPLPVTFGPTLSGKITFQGKNPANQSGSIFLGIASGTPTTKPTYILTLSITTQNDGSFNNISLAGLTIGNVYTAYLKGAAQIDAASTFTVFPGQAVLNNGQTMTLLSGDLNEDNVINTADATVAMAAFGTSTGQPNFNPRADLNGDGVVNSLDLAILNKNIGQIGASGIWYSSVPSIIPTPTTAALLPTASNIGGASSDAWSKLPLNH